MIRLLLADDHSFVMEGVQRMLQGHDDILIMATADDGKKALGLARAQHFDIVILDIDMPEMDGIDVARVLIKEKKDSKIIILTMHDKVVMAEKLLEIGVKGYLLKTASKQEFVSAILRVHEGGVALDDGINRRLMERTHNKQASGSRLVKREIQVLELVAEGLSSIEIADKLGLSIHTVNSYRKNILSKAGVRSVVDLINWARDNGFIL